MGDYSDTACYYNTLLAKAFDVVEKNISNPEFDINAFASEMCLGRTNLYYKIKRVTGLAPNEFVLDVKLKKSIVLLQESPELTISEIAYKLGFNKPSYFIQKFKNCFGTTPNQYRKQMLCER